MTLWDTANPSHPARIATLAVAAGNGEPTYGGELVGLTALAVSPSPAPGGLILASGDQSGVVTLWNATDPARTGRVVTLPSQGGAAVSALAFSPDGAEPPPKMLSQSGRQHRHNESDGSRATTATSDCHAARLVFQCANEPIADYFR